MVVDGVPDANLDVDDGLGSMVLGAQLQRRLDRAVQAAHRGVRLHHDQLGLPALAEPVDHLRGIGVVPLAEHGEEAAVGPLEDLLDPGVSTGGEACGE